MEDAYSLDYKDIIDAEKAYDLFWSGVITDKHNFQCQDPNCAANITCANIDKPRYAMKQVPHFRVVGIHNQKCELTENTVGGTSSTDNNEIGNSAKFINESVDVFLFDRPKKKPNEKAIGDSKEKHQAIKKKLYNDKKDNAPRNPEYSTIKPLVSKYEALQKLNQLDKHFISIVGNPISYSQMFVNMESVNFDNVSKYDRIYFGEAIIIQPQKLNAFIIKFKNKILRDGKQFETTIFIADSIIQNHYCRNLWRERLNEIVQSKQRAVFYIYSKPKVNERNNNYMNFLLTNLNYLDYRLI